MTASKNKVKQMMTTEKRIKRDINGILFLDKPVGLSSNRALQKVKYLLSAKKAGHTGSLDPLASGMLPLCFGEATKLSRYLLDSDKSYSVKAKLGIRTTTSDSEGEVVSLRSVPPMTMTTLDKALAHFRGEIQQVPSMFSALKHNGQPLYQLARQGITVERPARTIHIYSLILMDYRDAVVEFQLTCSKGTYVRTLVDDFGELLGCGAHVSELRRTSVSGFNPSHMHTLETLEQVFQDKYSDATLNQYLQPTETMVSHFPAVRLTESMAFYVRRGQAIQVPSAPTKGWVVLKLKSGELIGMGEVLDDGKITPRRMLTSSF